MLWRIKWEKYLKVKFLNAVCVERIAVGSIAVSTPMLDIIGKATVSEHFPIHDMSCIDTILFINPPFLLHLFIP